jgi:hypothetical protein
VAEKSLPGGDVADAGANPRCYLCGTDAELTYCSFCKKYFCAGCERDYPARVMAATVEGMAALKNFLASVLPSEPTVTPPKVAPPKEELCCGQRHRQD